MSAPHESDIDKEWAYVVTEEGHEGSIKDASEVGHGPASDAGRGDLDFGLGNKGKHSEQNTTSPLSAALQDKTRKPTTSTKDGCSTPSVFYDADDYSDTAVEWRLAQLGVGPRPESSSRPPERSSDRSNSGRWRTTHGGQRANGWSSSRPIAQDNSRPFWSNAASTGGGWNRTRQNRASGWQGPGHRGGFEQYPGYGHP
jgi:hypothetical protein